MNFYEKNLEALMQTNPVLGARLYSLAENKRYEVFVDEKDPINVNLYDTKEKTIFYATKPIDEVTAQYEAMLKKFARHPFLWFYGISNALLVKMFLNLDKTLFVIEPELELIYIALNLQDFSREITEKRLHIYLSSDVNFRTVTKLVDNHELKAFLKTFSLEITNVYYEHFYLEDIKRINALFVETIRDVIIKEGNDANDSLIGLNQHLKHIPQMLASYPMEQMKSKRSSDHAVIVSTGPSLSKQLPLLKKYQDYITILCVDASLPILQKEGIKPDFVFSLERMEPTAKFYENLDRELLKDTIFMPTSIVHPKLLENIGNMKKAITMRPFGYTKMFHMHKWGYIGVGMSAANMAFDFAYICQFKNIVLIGQDLAFGEGGNTHAKGAVYGEKEEVYEKGAFYIKGYYGNEIKTSRTWNLFLNTFKRDIPVATKEGINVYNCTEGGAYIDGAEHIPFAEFLGTIEKTPKEKIVYEYVSKKRQQHYLRRAKQLISLYIQRLGCIKEKVESVFLELMEKIEVLEKLNKDEELEQIDFDELAEVISKIDEVKDIYEDDRAMRKFMNITNPFIINAELELGRIMVRPSDTELEKKVKMIDWIYEHKSWLFFLAGAIENILHVLRENYEEIYKNIEVE